MTEPDPSEGSARYARQARFRALGHEGQQRIGSATALVVGVGALGTHIAQSLWRAGVGRLILVDRDIVEWDNLPRQTLFEESDARDAEPKAPAAARTLRRARSDGELEALIADFDAETFGSLSTRPDLIVDGTDNFAVRYRINDLAIAHDIPWIYGGAVGASGTAAVVIPGETPCLRCWMPEMPAGGGIDNCETVGVLEPTIAAVAAFQCAEAIKLLSGHPEAVTRGMFELDIWRGRYGVRLSEVGPRPGCRSCDTGELPALASETDRSTALCGREVVQVNPEQNTGLDLDRLAERLEGAVEELERRAHGLRFVVSGVRFSVFPGGRALLSGIDDPLRARALYDRWIGA